MTKRQELAERADELLVAAFNGAIETLSNPDAPATAKASATGSAIRLFELLRPDDGQEREPSDMTAGELQRSIARLKAELEVDPKDPESGIFG